MTAVLQVMLDAGDNPLSADIADAGIELTRALIAGAPGGCAVAAVAPAGPEGKKLAALLPGLDHFTTTGLGRRELAVALQMGLATGIRGGMIHAPSLFAPLVRHDRVHHNDQTVATVWDLTPWQYPHVLPRAVVAWHKAMLRRAARHADAVVVPTHAMADQLAEIARLDDRIRVIPGAAPADLAAAEDHSERRKLLDLPEDVVVVSGGTTPIDGVIDALRAVGASGIDNPVVVLDAAAGEEPALADLAGAAGVAQRRVHIRGVLTGPERAAVFDGAVAFITASKRVSFPWRVLEALRASVPVLAVATPVHRDVIVDAGVLIDAEGEGLSEGLGDALSGAVQKSATQQRLQVRSADRGRAFSWSDAADRVWQLHADI